MIDREEEMLQRQMKRLAEDSKPQGKLGDWFTCLLAILIFIIPGGFMIFLGVKHLMVDQPGGFLEIFAGIPLLLLGSAVFWVFRK